MLNNVIEEIDLKKDSLNKLSEDLINGDKKTLIVYLDKELDNDIEYEKNLEETLDKIEDLLGINFSK